MTVHIDYDEVRSRLILRGSIDRLSRNPLFRTYLRSRPSSVVEVDRIVIPATNDALGLRYGELERLLNRLGISVETSESTSVSLQEVEDEAIRFRQFTDYAYAIWNSDIDPDGFADFMNSVRRACPGRTFYRLQLLSAFHLSYAQNVCNFSVPGSGKTSIVYAAFAYLNGLQSLAKHVDRLLVIGPLSSFKAWEDEYQEIFSRFPRVKRIAGSLDAASRRDFLHGVAPESRDTELVLTSYQSLDRHLSEFKTFLAHSSKATMLVLDEAHYIKRSDGQWASAALALAPFARSRVVLTGTPAPNGYEDLANLFEFIYPGRNVIGYPYGTLRAMTEGRLSSAVPQLNNRLKGLYTRIKKSNLELPESYCHSVFVEMSAAQRGIYDAIEQASVRGLSQGSDRANVSLAAARLVRMRQAASNPTLLLAPLELENTDRGRTDLGRFSLHDLAITDAVRSFEPTGSLAKLDALKSLISEILECSEKVLIWSSFIGNLELLEVELAPLVNYVDTISGADPMSSDDDDVDTVTRESIIDRFNTPGESAILIANPQAVGESISLHRYCHHAIYFDRDFNAGRFIQSKDRIHRVGLQRSEITHYYFLIANSSIEESIDRRLTEKERRMLDLIESDDIPLFSLVDSDESIASDIAAVLRDYESRAIL